MLMLIMNSDVQGKALTMLQISILKIKDPGCFWGRVVEGAGETALSPAEYENLQVSMNLFYHKVNLDVEKIKPSSVEEGLVCVVYSPTLKSWCRAIVETVFQGSGGHRALCFLADHAEHIVVCSDSVRTPLEDFMKLPFWVKKFQLAGICPISLQFSIFPEKAELIPAAHWDSSATRYLHNLVKASVLIQAVISGTHGDSIAIELYLTIRSVKICVNDDLVTKKFACFSSERARAGPQMGHGECPPLMWAYDIFSSHDSPLTQNARASRALWSAISPSRDLQDVDPGEHYGAHPSVEGGSGIISPQVSQQDPVLDVLHPKTQYPGAGATEPAVNREGLGDGCVLKRDPGSDVRWFHGPSDCEKDNWSDGKLTTDTESSLTEELSKKLNLFRYINFLNPAHKNEPVESGAEEDWGSALGKEPRGSPVTGGDTAPSDQECGDEDKPEGFPELECLEHSSSDDLSEDQRRDAALADTWQLGAEEDLGAEGELACARLLQFLNPDPLNRDEKRSDTTPVLCKPSSWGIVVHSAFALEPCTSLASAPLTEGLRKTLSRTRYSGPKVEECYCWPAVARGCDTVLITHSGEDPLTYLPPFLSQLQLSSVFNILTSRYGPIAVIVCPGWEKAQKVFSLLEVTPSLQPMIVLVGLGKDEAKFTKIQRNCQVLVTTPFSLVRLLSFQCFLFLRLCHLVLDEVDELYSRAPVEMSTILRHFQKVTASKERASSPRQIVAVGKRWSRQVEDLVREYMSDPYVIITAMEEAALYGGVHQMVLLCLDCTKMSVLLSALDFIPDVPQKTLIITNSVEEAEGVFKAVSYTSAFCLKAHERLTYLFDFVIEQWRADIGHGTHVILVVTNECLKALAIQDATCVVHYGFPNSPKQFGSRLHCMLANFQNLSDKDCASKPSHTPKSVLLLTERNVRHVVGVLRYLERTDAVLPPELLLFAQGVMQAKEEQKAERPLCSYLKSLGFCRDSRVCADRHCVIRTKDSPRHSGWGTILVLPLYIKNASCYYGRIIGGKEDCYESLAKQMAEYYSSEKFNPKEVLEGGLYAIQEEGVYHRVQVLAVPENGERLFRSVTARFLDEGREQEVKAHQLLMLPGQFQSLPAQAVEIIVCRVQPSDGEMDWNPKVSRHISQKIKGLQHQAKVVLCLGNTVWVDPMVRMTRLPGLKASLNEYSVRSEILSTGMGADNPQHVERLRELGRGGGVTGGATEPAPRMTQKALEETLENRLKGAEEALAGTFKEASEVLRFRREVSTDCPGEETVAACATALEDERPALSGSLANGLDVDDQNHVPFPSLQPFVGALKKWPHAATPALDNRSVPTVSRENECQDSNASLENKLDVGPCNDRQTVTGKEKLTPPAGVDQLKTFSPKNWLSGSHFPLENGVKQTEVISVVNTKRFHPQIKWFQQKDCIILNIKLLNPVGQKCEFFLDRVVYSASVNDRLYHADLWLRGNIQPDKCAWDLKFNEPVLRLMKADGGLWDTLLKHKNAFVTFDFDHFEDEDEETVTGCSFTEQTGEEWCYVGLESDSDSDSE